MTRNFFSRFTRQQSSGKQHRRAKRRRKTDRALRVTGLDFETLEDRRLLAAGALDPTFGTGGISVDNLQLNKDDVVQTVAIQNVLGEDKIVVAGYQKNSVGFGSQVRDVMVARFNADGTRDLTFGTGGFTVIDASTVSPGEDGVSDLLIDASNRILVFGTARTTATPGFLGVLTMRFTEGGLLDTSFDGDGKVITALPASVVAATDSPSVVSAEMQSDGKIVVGATVNSGGATLRNFAVIRYNADGTLDTGFDGDGFAIADFSNHDDNLGGIAIQSDGKIVAVGSTRTAAALEDFGLIRFDANGMVDATFGVSGRVITNIVPTAFSSQDRAMAVFIEPDGQIVVGGYSLVRNLSSSQPQHDMVVARYNSNGTLDNAADSTPLQSFGTGVGSVLGTTRVTFNGTLVNREEVSFALIAQPQPDGKYLLGGHFELSTGEIRIGLARLLATDGALDVTFDGDGRTEAIFAGQTDLVLSELALQPDGKIVGAGWQLATGGGVDVALARWESGLLVADAGGPYVLSEPGGSVTLSGSGLGAGTLTYDWDLDDDGIFGETGAGALYGDETGMQPFTAPVFTVSGVDGPTVFNVTLRVSSDENGDTIIDQIAFDSTTVTVENVAPTITADNATVTANEGDTATNSGAFDDVGPDVVTLTASIGTVIDNGDGTWSWSYGTADGPDDSQLVTITATDDDGDSSDVSFQLNVDNVAPSVAADNGVVTVNEGDSATNSGTYDDPGVDTVTLVASVGILIDNGDGTWSWSYGTSDGPDDSVLVTITATDSDGDSSDTSFQVIVDNVAPTVAADNASVTVNEGDIATNTGTVNDVGVDTVTLVASVGILIDNGDGTWSWSYGTADGPDDSGLVTITATDSDGDSSNTSFQLNVNNVAPTLTIGGAASVNEGSSYTLNLASLDPGADTITSWTINWGDGSQTISGNPASATHTYADGGNPNTVYAVSATATDEDGTFSSNSISVTVNNVAPTASTGGPYTVGEGGTVTLSGSGTDVAGAADPLSFAWDLDNNGSFETIGATVAFSAAGLDGPTSRTVKLRVSDGDGGVTVATTTVSVVNVAPTADAGGPYLTFDDTPIALSGSGTDPAGALDPLTFAWDLDGDNIFGETGVGATRGNEVGANPTFNPTGLSTGSYTVKLRVSDGDGGVTTDTATVNVLTSGTLLIDGVLYVVGTNNYDIVLISKCNSTIFVCATFNDDNPMTFNSADVTDIQIRMRGGADIVLTTSNVMQTMTIDGGAGNDLLTGGGGRNLIMGGSGNDFLYGADGDDVLLGGTGNDLLAGGGGNDVLVGGDGSDILLGGAGRDLIIGGQDSDLLEGGGGEDILIGGYTIHDNNLAALDAVMAIWKSSAAFATRVNTLKNTGGLLQGGVTVFDDDDCDLIDGGADRDLVFGDTYLWDGAIDLIALQQAQDVLVAVN